jgi:hypothetical protein
MGCTPLTCVGETGIEPVTSSVSSKDHDRWTRTCSAHELGISSVVVHQRPWVCVAIVTQLDTHAGRAATGRDHVPVRLPPPEVGLLDHIGPAFARLARSCNG